MSRFHGIRYSLIVMLLPLVIMIVIVSGVFSVNEARSALTSLANRHIAFKAEELRDFAYSEWESLKSYKLDGNAELRSAAVNSILAYARSLLREGSEKIYVFNNEDILIWELDLSEGLRKIDRDSGSDLLSPAPGWVEFQSEGNARVGIAFDFTPFGWTIIVSEFKSAFFTEVWNMERNNGLILLISILAMLLLIPLSLGHVIRHLETLSSTASEITESEDFSRRVKVESGDETGLLAERFNAMLDTLQEGNRKLEAKSLAEKEAREAAESHEKEALFLLSRISDIRDEDTGNHLKRIGLLSAYMGELLNLSPYERNILLNSAPLHDIGKIGVPDAILLKTGTLTEDEYEKMQSHTTLGYRLLESSQSRYLREGAAIALTHHERWDGSGYPSGLKGEAIPLYGRIVSIVDVFDALLSDRPYKKSFSPEETLDYIRSQRGKHFDPALTDLVLKHFNRFLKIHSDEQPHHRQDDTAVRRPESTGITSIP